MDHLGGGPVHYCGESLGGILGIVMGATIPERLRSLTLLAAPVTIPKATQEAFACGHPTWQDALRIMGSRGWSDYVNGATRFPPDADPAMVRWYADEMGKSPVEVLIALSRMDDVQSALRRQLKLRPDQQAGWEQNAEDR
jgi:3-oxoadipate enol-lactonase